MFRIQWRLPADQVVPPLPEPAPLNVEKYWMTGGYLKVDISKEPDVSKINFVEAIESCKPWEHLKLPINCTMCSDKKRNLQYLYQVHWCYLHCRTCKETFICGECSATDAFAELRKSQHEDHEFVRIQTRPKSAPLFDGSSLKQLQYFQKADNDDEFFLYFPWFFHTFPGMDNFANHYRRIFIDDMNTRPDKGEPGWLALRSRLRFPTDWFMRCYAQGAWEPLHRNLGPTIKAQIQIAQKSAELHALLVRLQDLNREKAAQYGGGDIPAHPTARAAAANLTRRLAPNQVEYLLYTFPVQFTGVLNDQIEQERVQSLALSTLISSDDTMSDMTRLWRMFVIIFQELPLFDSLVSLSSSGHTFVNLQYLKPEWEQFATKDQQIRKKLKDVYSQEVSPLPNMEFLPRSTNTVSSFFGSIIEDSCPKAPAISSRSLSVLHLWASRASSSEDSTINGSLAWCAHQRRIGNFEEAITVLRSMDLADPNVALQLQRAYMEQGYLEKAMHCLDTLLQPNATIFDEGLSQKFANLQMDAKNGQSTMTNIANPPDVSPVTRHLVMLISKYLSCSVSGGWEDALDVAQDVFTTYLRSWALPNASRESPLLLVYLEMYYHLVLVEVGRDLISEVDRTNGIERLQTIRLFLMNLNAFPDVIWDIIITELELSKPTGRAQYWDHEMNFSVHQYRHRVPEALQLLEKFSIWEAKLEKRSPMLAANALLLQAELSKEAGMPVPILEHKANQASSCYRSIDSSAGQLDVEFFRIKYLSDVPFQRVKDCYDQLRSRNDIHRMRTVRAYQMAPSNESSEWLLLTRDSLRKLAKEAGDSVAYHRWNLRRYAPDNMIVSSIGSAEAIIESDKGASIHSNLLTTMASFNLSRAFLTLGNYFEASINGILHAALTKDQNDVENHQRAILNLLQIFTEALNADQVHGRKVMKELSSLWKGWLHFPAPERWKIQGPRCDEMDRLIDGACFLPILSGKLGISDSLFHDTYIEDTLISHLHLAFALYDALPPYMLSMIGPRLALAAGAVAAYVGNKELAIRTYWEGYKSCHTQDLFTIGVLRLEAGKLMTLLAEGDPEHWLHVVASGRSLIRGAGDLFMEEKMLSGSLLKVLESNMWLLRSYVAQARAIKLTLDRETDKLTNFTDVEQLVKKVRAISDVLELATKPMWGHEVIVAYITERLRLESPYEATRHMVSLSSSHILQKTRHLTLEVCLIMKDFELLQGKIPGSSLWSVTQRFKASVLFQQSQYIVNPVEILREIEKDPEASRIYAREKELIQEGPQSMGDHRLNSIASEMSKNPVLLALMERRTTRGIELDELEPLKEIACATSTSTTSIITVDWIQYNDIFMVIGYNISLAKIIFLDLTVSCGVVDVERWVKKHLKVSPANLHTTLGSPDVFDELRPLISMIGNTCKEGDLLVFCPSQLLNAVPLHAIPYNNIDSIPLIYYHPVVYAPSNAILKDCVQRALNPRPRRELHASLSGRYGDSRQAEESAIQNGLLGVAALLTEANISVKVVLGRDVTYSTFSANLTGADILHFQGHVSSPDIKQFLVLEPDEASKIDAFTLQDIFSTGLDASLVVLMGCGSGSQVISRGDDSMGLISAFFASGVTSVIGTLWPLDNGDAVKFSRDFYRIFVQDRELKQKNLVNLAAGVRTAVLEMRACQREKCKERRDLKGRLKCHLDESNAPYHWAQFALWGSWVCQGMGKAGGEEFNETWSFTNSATQTE